MFLFWAIKRAKLTCIYDVTFAVMSKENTEKVLTQTDTRGTSRQTPA